MAAYNLLGLFLAQGRQGYIAVRLVVYQSPVGKGLKGGGHRGPGHADSVGNVLGPGNPLLLLQVKNRFQIVFQAGSQLLMFLGCHFLPSINFRIVTLLFNY